MVEIDFGNISDATVKRWHDANMATKWHDYEILKMKYYGDIWDVVDRFGLEFSHKMFREYFAILYINYWKERLK